MTRIIDFLTDARGEVALEYVFIAAGLSILILGGASQIGISLKGLISPISDTLSVK